jgi:hypothetical protein
MSIPLDIHRRRGLARHVLSGHSSTTPRGATRNPALALVSRGTEPRIASILPRSDSRAQNQPGLLQRTALQRICSHLPTPLLCCTAAWSKLLTFAKALRRSPCCCRGRPGPGMVPGGSGYRGHGDGSPPESKTACDTPSRSQCGCRCRQATPASGASPLDTAPQPGGSWC